MFFWFFIKRNLANLFKHNLCKLCLHKLKILLNPINLFKFSTPQYIKRLLEFFKIFLLIIFFHIFWCMICYFGNFLHILFLLDILNFLVFLYFLLLSFKTIFAKFLQFLFFATFNANFLCNFLNFSIFYQSVKVLISFSVNRKMIRNLQN